MWKRVRKLGGLAEKVWKKIVEMKREDFFFFLHSLFGWQENAGK
jgi:hypothetical protein